jgi:GNAT superfamily N-acetyltransferase
MWIARARWWRGSAGSERAAPTHEPAPALRPAHRHPGAAHRGRRAQRQRTAATGLRRWLAAAPLARQGQARPLRQCAAGRSPAAARHAGALPRRFRLQRAAADRAHHPLHPAARPRRPAGRVRLAALRRNPRDGQGAPRRPAGVERQPAPRRRGDLRTDRRAVARQCGRADRRAHRAPARKSDSLPGLSARGRPQRQPAGLRSEDGLAGLYDVFTPEAQRRRGHARQLCLALLHAAREQGARHAYLQVSDDNGAAIALYESLGFQLAYRYHYRSEQPGVA